MNTIRILIPILFCFSVSVQPAALHAAEKSAEPIFVMVSIVPQAYFVERIGGRRVSIEVLVLPGENPETYKPSPVQMDGIVKSDIYFRIGMPFEEMLLPKIKTIAKKVQIVDTRKGISLRRLESGLEHRDDHAKMKREHGDQDSAGKGHIHEFGGSDPHIWLSPSLVKQQAETIWSTLIRFDPAGEEEYTANFKGFIKDIEILQRKIAATLAPFKGESIYVFHPAFGYFTDEYGLRQVAVEVEGKAPKGKELANFIKMAKKEKMRVIFVQPQFDKGAASKIADAIHGEVMPIDPLAKDYLINLEEMSRKISESFGR